MAASRETVPLPPFELANRVGSLADADDPWMRYEELGGAIKRSIVDVLPSDWTFAGRRVYEFGCGAGRTLRHFLEEARTCEFHASDIDRRSIAWLAENLSPPFHVFVNAEEPPLPFGDGSLDLVYSVSVFTHLVETWSAWLLELHRTLAPDGLAIITFIGPGAAPSITPEPWDEDVIGMNVLKPGQPWELGGPMVLHSPWWIRAHWGRAFEILDLRPCGFGAAAPHGQGVVLLCKRACTLTAADLERPEPAEPRELLAAREQARQLIRETVDLRAQLKQLESAWQGERDARAQLERRTVGLQSALDGIAASRSWRLTAPLRRLARFRHRFKRPSDGRQFAQRGRLDD